MTATVLSLLQPLKDRLAAANACLSYSEESVERLAAHLYRQTPAQNALGVDILWAHLIDPSLDKWRAVARGVTANAPTDQAKLIAAVEAVESLASRTVNAPIEYSAGYLALDILAALTQALGGDTA